MKKIILLMIVFGIILIISFINFVSGGNEAFSKYSNTSAYFFNEGTNVIYDNSTSPNATTITCGGTGCRYNSSGLEGNYSLIFNASNFISIPFNTSRANFTDFIISMYIYTNKSSSSTNRHNFLITQDEVGSVYNLQVADSNRLSFVTGTRGALNWFEHSITINSNNWTHIVAWTNESHGGVFAGTAGSYLSYNETLTGGDWESTRTIYYGAGQNGALQPTTYDMIDCLNQRWGSISPTLIDYFMNLSCVNSTTTTTTTSENLNNTCIPPPDAKDWIVINKYLTCNINYTIDKGLNNSNLIVNAGTVVVPQTGVIKTKKCIFNGGSLIFGGRTICG